MARSNKQAALALALVLGHSPFGIRWSWAIRIIRHSE
jgi:hypothetical protein